MSRKLLSLTAGALLSLGLAGTAFAGGPVTLSGDQMDNVTAGGIAIALAGANAWSMGETVAGTGTMVNTGTYTNDWVAVSHSSSGAASLSISF
ncbi:MAG: hypothetical protein M0Z28_13760 [Rhodospirillales bacterium]|nr:hypothetical protein [Rhodospirillales bacterium]